MEVIGETALWSFLSDKKGAQQTTNTAVRKDSGCKVATFVDLATKVAELQFRNRDYVLFFRGQGGDYRNSKDNSSLKPTLFRSDQGPTKFPNPNRLARRFEILKEAEVSLVRRYSAEGLLGMKRLKRQRIVRWSILQHYEICRTPLIDVTHSLRIAASFASEKSKKAFVFVVGVPNLSGAVTASAEAGIQIIRLSSVCPPSAVRPHVQEGYLLGEYPEMFGFDQKAHYEHSEVDFGRRLIAKFWFNPDTFWKKDTFPRVARQALYPNFSDPLYELAEEIKASIDTSED